MRHNVKVIRRSEALPSHLTWDQVAKYVLPVMGIGFVLALWQPVILTPPFKQYTGLIYAMLAIVWIPVLLFFARQHPSGPTWKPYGLSALGGIPILVVLSLLLGTLISFNFEPKCEKLTETAWSIRYECRTGFMGDAYLKETFDTLPLLPLMWQVEKKNCSPNGCY